MTMARNNRNYQLDPNGGNGGSSFQEHDEHMRGFRRAHAGVAMVNAPRWDKATLIESMEDNLRQLREQVGKVLMQQIDAGDKESIELLSRLKRRENNESGIKPK